MNVIFTLDNIEEAANIFLAASANHKVIAFYGEMGAGKTTFIHAFCVAMGVTDHVTSPTFSIINQYNSAGVKPIYHLDLYRISDDDDAIKAGVEDCLHSGNTCLVEWPEKAPGVFPDDYLSVIISVVDGKNRKIEW